MQIAKLTLIGAVVRNKIGGLHINSLACRLGADEVYLARLELAHHYFIAQTDKVVVDDVLYHLFNVPLA